MNLLAPLRNALAQYPVIGFAIAWIIALAVVGLIAMPFDHRIILGLNPWIKPLKFEISLVIFLSTVALMLDALRCAGKWSRTLRFLAWGFSISMVAEISIIALQSARGVRSHMNFATPHDALLFSIMGAFIALNTALSAWLLVLWCVAPTSLRPAVVWGIRLGLLMLLVASIEGVRIVTNGAHTVGASDGGPGLPFINWSTQHGDLRVAHFFGLHGLQLFPLSGIALARSRLSDGAQVAALVAFTIVYAAGVGWLFAHAMRGLAITL